MQSSRDRTGLKVPEIFQVLIVISRLFPGSQGRALPVTVVEKKKATKTWSFR